eukprot:TRINITY_DN4321_c0_g1_i4.p1 TRINITY_DN4321_c0_g1~~TRINITY_DN4321_c0_g1_i4.p1  ORF type:complete len:146 (-),score=23.88 TRINITY_DN4321_c0_g1_i4:103-540(-)
MRCYHVTYEKALRTLRTRRSVAYPNRGFAEQLKLYETDLTNLGPAIDDSDGICDLSLHAFQVDGYDPNAIRRTTLVERVGEEQLNMILAQSVCEDDLYDDKEPVEEEKGEEGQRVWSPQEEHELKQYMKEEQEKTTENVPAKEKR